MAGLIMLVGLIGIVVPVLPGLFLVWAAVLIWAVGAGAPAAWAVLGAATILALGGLLARYVLPGRRLRTAGVPTSTTLAGMALAVAGFFVLPVVGAFVGFVLGVYLAERVRLADGAMAWTSTRHALKAVGLSMGIELGTGLAIAITWVVGLLTV
ncbi:MAG: DUF456 domain-containing protein [Actinomycetota bacterium]